jgi:hypothetical protein
MNNYEGSYYGFPLKSQDDSEPDCRRTSWSVLVDDEWHEVICCSLDWREADAADGLLKILSRSKRRTEELVEHALVEAQALAGDEPYNNQIRIVCRLLQEALSIKQTKQCVIAS